jgi:hypothetical protein
VDRHPLPGQQRLMTARRVLGDEDIPDQPALSGGRNKVDAFGEKQSRATPTYVTMQLDRGGHPGRAFGEHGPPRLITSAGVG